MQAKTEASASADTVTHGYTRGWLAGSRSSEWQRRETMADRCTQTGLLASSWRGRALRIERKVGGTLG